jgi:NADH:flavin oxidoreductase / NADH oxidase family
VSILQEPLDVGDLRLPNRILMAPLTCSRAGEQRIPNALMAQYYIQRASAGLILTEATSMAPMDVSYAHAAWHLVGGSRSRAGNSPPMLSMRSAGVFSSSSGMWGAFPVFLNGDLPVAPSAVTLKSNVNLQQPTRLL